MTKNTPMTDLELLTAACCVAGLDGQVCEKELPILKQLAERAGVGKASLEAMMDRAVSDQSFYEQQLEIVTRTPDRTLKMLFLIAVSDEELGVPERVILHYFADKLEISQDRFNQILAAAEKEVSRATKPQ